MPTVLIVDHGLREGSHKDAALTAAWAEDAGFTAHVLRWKGAKPKANIEDEARAARYRLMGHWCRDNGVASLLVAHTEDDQAETFLLRLGRGSGVDGLSAMRPRAPLPTPGGENVTLCRPLLGIGREDLRAYLKSRNASWLEDPMNADAHFARVRLRALLPHVEAAGVPRRRIAAAAAHLARVREALERATGDFLQSHARVTGKTAILDAGALKKLPREMGLRALSAFCLTFRGKPTVRVSSAWNGCSTA